MEFHSERSAAQCRTLFAESKELSLTSMFDVNPRFRVFDEFSERCSTLRSE